MSDTGNQWYFDLTTGEVSQDKNASWDNRMGPYGSETEAHNALTVAKNRNKAADAAEEADEDWGVAPSWEKGN
ncbi:hypothetical protein [Corynebacterium sp. A21]|uniref:hypothetical protein n=1 Tax=Corynebacterium sp. A21 TaxID=3457318 RepID=UPI003FD22386